ncbi:hypothetical protein CLAIMM_09292 [Cladophialophora immunda]|nr:hypothetical protein CLAIMM_09292 [Cladophialophora immunda]
MCVNSSLTATVNPDLAECQSLGGRTQNAVSIDPREAARRRAQAPKGTGLQAQGTRRWVVARAKLVYGRQVPTPDFHTDSTHGQEKPTGCESGARFGASPKAPPQLTSTSNEFINLICAVQSPNIFSVRSFSTP